MKKRTKTLLLTAALSVGLSMPAMAADVQAVLPDFPVTLNGTTIDNSYRQYPLLVYNNITYFPMTYYDCRFLGVETEWTQQSGLKIEKSTLTGAYHQDNMSQKNGKRTTAQLATGKITVNGKSINNSKETYPLLVYRNVTYFPLTWRFAVNEFGWKYNYDNKNGLVIDAGNAKTKSITLKDGRSNIGAYDKFGFAMDKQYLYYEGEKGAIYRRPLANLSDDKQRATIMGTAEYDRAVKLYEEGGNIYAYYYSGGATMGSDHYWLLQSNGTAKEVVNGKFDYHDFGNFQIMANKWVPPMPSKLICQENGKERELGEEGFQYGAGKYGMYVWQDKVYCVEWGKEETNINLSVDLKTGKTTSVSQYPSGDFQVDNGVLYYLCNVRQDGKTDVNSNQQYLYAVDLSNGKETYVGYVGFSDTSHSTLYAAANNGVYYRDQSSGSLIFYNALTGKREVLNDGFKVNRLTAEQGYVIAHFEEHPKSSCRLAVYQTSGNGYKQVFSSSDCSDGVAVNANGLLMYRLENTSQLVQVQLK